MTYYYLKISFTVFRLNQEKLISCPLVFSGVESVLTCRNMGYLFMWPFFPHDRIKIARTLFQVSLELIIQV